MKISYAVTVVNEIKEIQQLLPILIENKVWPYIMNLIGYSKDNHNGR